MLTQRPLPAALTHGAALTQNPTLFTVIETPTFTRLWTDYWDEDERGEFVATIYLLLIYAKGVGDDINAKTLDRIRRTLDGEDD